MNRSYGVIMANGSNITDFVTWLLYKRILETKEWYDKLIEERKHPDNKNVSNENLVRDFISTLFSNYDYDITCMNLNDAFGSIKAYKLLLLDFLKTTHEHINHKELGEALFKDIN